MFARLADFVARHWLLVLLAWLVIPLVVSLKAPSWDDVAQDGDLAFLPPRMTSARGEELVRRAFPDQEDKSDVVLIVARPDGPLGGADYAVADRLAREFAPPPESKGLIVAVHSADDPVVGEKLTSRVGRHGQATLVLLELRTEFMAVENMNLLDHIERRLDESAAAPIFPRGSSWASRARPPSAPICSPRPKRASTTRNGPRWRWSC